MRSLAGTNASGRADFISKAIQSRSAGSSRHVWLTEGSAPAVRDGVAESRGPARPPDDAAPGSPRKNHAQQSLREQVGRDERAGAAGVERDEVVGCPRVGYGSIDQSSSTAEIPASASVSATSRVSGEPGGRVLQRGGEQPVHAARHGPCAQSWARFNLLALGIRRQSRPGQGRAASRPTDPSVHAREP